MNKYRCAYCGEKLTLMNVSIAGPYKYFFCYKSVCRGASKFLSNAINAEIDRKIRQIIK